MPFSARVLALVALAALVLPASNAPAAPSIQPDPEVAHYAVPAAREPKLSREREVALLHKKIRYIFVIYQENRSFDSYFGTFPGADGLFSQPAADTPGFNQPIENVDGTQGSVQPFRIGPREYASDLSDVGHSHSELLAKMDIVAGTARMDRYAQAEEDAHIKRLGLSLPAKQFGELTMAYQDGDTIPFLWRYANRFVLCDHIFQLMTGPSTPGNIAIIAAQTGETQWMLHPEEAGSGKGGRGVPIVDDTNPIWGSPLDPFKDVDGIPYNPKDSAKIAKSGIVQLNLTFATVPLTLTGSALGDVAKSDRDPNNDLRDIHEDIAKISASGQHQLGWGWYQEGYGSDPKPTGGADPLDAEGRHFSFVTHHDGPQYFGYLANNPKMSASMKGLTDFLADVKNQALPPQGGLFFLKGGGHNFLGLSPADPNLPPKANFYGDDDHPGDSDSQISEAMAAEMIDAIAQSPYWDQCAIIITWDDSQGAYDHVPPPIRSFGPDGTPQSDGPRVPFLLISPYAKTHVVDHDEGDQACVVKFADTVFGLIPLADLPDEEKGREIGLSKGLKNEGPLDDQVTGITDLVSAFDPARLAGRSAPLPASYAVIPEDLIRKLPQETGIGLAWVGIEPTDYQQGIANPVPPDFSPRP